MNGCCIQTRISIRKMKGRCSTSTLTEGGDSNWIDMDMEGSHRRQNAGHEAPSALHLWLPFLVTSIVSRSNLILCLYPMDTWSGSWLHGEHWQYCAMDVGFRGSNNQQSYWIGLNLRNARQDLDILWLRWRGQHHRWCQHLMTTHWIHTLQKRSGS